MKEGCQASCILQNVILELFSCECALFFKKIEKLPQTSSEVIKASIPTTAVSKSGASNVMTLEGEAGITQTLCVGPDTAYCQKKRFIDS